jgi:hypothetical protein
MNGWGCSPVGGLAVTILPSRREEDSGWRFPGARKPPCGSADVSRDRSKTTAVRKESVTDRRPLTVSESAAGRFRSPILRRVACVEAESTWAPRPSDPLSAKSGALEPSWKIDATWFSTRSSSGYSAQASGPIIVSPEDATVAGSRVRRETGVLQPLADPRLECVSRRVSRPRTWARPAFVALRAAR